MQLRRTRNVRKGIEISLEIPSRLCDLGERTLLVLTKLDLADKKQLQNFINNKEEQQKFALGVVGLVNRNQEDIDNGVNLDTAAENEKKELVKKLGAEIAARHGISQLTSLLNRVLTAHIKRHLPGILRHIQEVRRENQTQLEAILPPLEVNNSKRAVIEVISAFCGEFAMQMNGRRGARC